MKDLHVRPGRMQAFDPKTPVPVLAVEIDGEFSMRTGSV
jgi:hypothetical protein